MAPVAAWDGNRRQRGVDLGLYRRKMVRSNGRD